MAVYGYVDPSCPEVVVHADMHRQIRGGLMDDDGVFSAEVVKEGKLIDLAMR